MDTNKCPCCGKVDSFKQKEKDFSVVYGQKTSTGKLFVLECDNCGAEFDCDAEKNDKIRKETMLSTRQESVCDSLKNIEEKISFAELERCFYLAPKTLSKWKTKEKSPSAAAAAFINLINVFPWLSLVGMANYNPIEAYKIACAAVVQKIRQNTSNFVFPLSTNAYDAVVFGYEKTQSYNETIEVDIPSFNYVENSTTLSYGV